MKKILNFLILGFVLTLFINASCTEPDPPIPTGDHTFSCSINGELFLPKGTGGGWSSLPTVANHERLRPILMTAIALVFGVFPIALAAGAGAEWKIGLACVIIGGLISSLFLILIIVSVIYEIMEKLIAKFSKGAKVDYEDEMIADYEHRELNADEFNPKHTV